MATHRRLGGVYAIGGNEDGEGWFAYKRSMYRVADGVKAGDRACVELAIRYIELHHIGSYSGYIRALLARRLKHVELTEDQKRRLIHHFEQIVANRDYRQEFRDYKKLWRRIDPLFAG